MSGVRLTGGALKELRLHICQRSTASAGARQFMEQHYVPLKQVGRECWSVGGDVGVRLTGGALKKLRLHICQRSTTSAGARQFMEQHYVPLKQENPRFPILVRECSGILPRLWARYEFGRETSVSLDGKSADEVLSALKTLAN